jgi:UDP-glucose 4-epimerase
MKVLITGGAGEVGKYLTNELLGFGHEISVLDLPAKAPAVEKDSRITFTPGNLIDAELVNNALHGVDVVIHLAWSFSDDPRVVFGEDIKGHINLLEAASFSKVSHFIYASTATVYGRAVHHPVTENHLCLIGDARKPLYALGKRTAEELCLLYWKERNLPVTIFRFWWAFGEAIGGRHLRDLIKKALAAQPLEMVRGAGGAFLTMSDLGSAVLLALANPSAAEKTYNLGSLFLTWEEIGETILKLTHSASAINFIPSEKWQGPAFLNEVWDLSWEKAEREIGYKPRSSVDQMRSQFSAALKNCIDQVRNQR